MLDSIDTSTIVRLAEVAGPCASIFVPTSPTGRGRMEGRIRLKNQLTEAENALTMAGMRATVARDLLGPAHRLVEDEHFWEQPMEGLAVYVAPGFFKWFALDGPPHARTEVGERFIVRPLLSLMRRPVFYVLALDQAGTRLVRVTSLEADELVVPDMPVKIEEIVGLDYSEKQMQMHHAGGRPLMHGAGDRAADPKDRILRFCHAIDRAVARFLADSRALLVLAADDPALDIYRKASHYRYIADEAIHGSPRLLAPQDLAEKARPIAESDRERRVTRLTERFRAMAPRFLASDSIPEVAKAIEEGRVDAILTPRIYNGDSPLDVVTEKQLNAAIIGTIQHGGVVHLIEQTKMPTNEPIAALYRY